MAAGAEKMLARPQPIAPRRQAPPRAMACNCLPERGPREGAGARWGARRPACRSTTASVRESDPRLLGCLQHPPVRFSSSCFRQEVWPPELPRNRDPEKRKRAEAAGLSAARSGPTVARPGTRLARLARPVRTALGCAGLGQAVICGLASRPVPSPRPRQPLTRPSVSFCADFSSYSCPALPCVDVTRTEQMRSAVQCALLRVLCTLNFTFLTSTMHALL